MKSGNPLGQFKITFRHLRTHTMISLRALPMLAVAFVPFWAALAQDRTGATLPSAHAPADDAEWVALRDASQHREPQLAKGVNGAGAAPTRERVVADYLEQADRLQSYVRRNPHRPESREAKRLEALALTHAARAGDESQKARREGLVAEVRGDRTLPARDRSMLAAPPGSSPASLPSTRSSHPTQ